LQTVIYELGIYINYLLLIHSCKAIACCVSYFILVRKLT